MATWLQPVVKSMVLCEDVLPGPEGTDNLHLMNTFTAIRPQSFPPFPHLFPQLCVFLELTDAEGEAPVWVLARHAESDREVFGSGSYSVSFPDQLHVVRAVFRLQDCRFPKPGLYSIEFFCDGQCVADHRLALEG
jgi:hypothetical protein